MIDDLGNDAAAVERIARWPYAVTGAVLPELPGSAAAARRLARSGKEVLLHLPMEPKGFPEVRPGPGAVLRSQSEEEIVRTLAGDLDTVPGAIGVNNHMGSALTTDRDAMDAVMTALRERGLYFVDSRTSADSTGFAVAREMGMPAAERQVFLDDDPEPAAIREEFSRLRDLAASRGAAIAIAHPRATTLEVLREEVPRALADGYVFVPVSFLLERPSVPLE